MQINFRQKRKPPASRNELGSWQLPAVLITPLSGEQVDHRGLYFLPEYADHARAGDSRPDKELYENAARARVNIEGTSRPGNILNDAGGMSRTGKK